MAPYSGCPALASAVWPCLALARHLNTTSSQPHATCRGTMHDVRPSLHTNRQHCALTKILALAASSLGWHCLLGPLSPCPVVDA